MDIFAGLVVILLGAALVTLIVSPGTARSLDTFAAGFLPYRSAGWPQGVQEEEPVRWSWSAPGGRVRLAEGWDSAVDGPEVVEIGGADAPMATPVGPRSTVHRTVRPAS